MQGRAGGAQTPYEVYCPSCRVTFPVGTRRCIHCGGRLGQRGEAVFEGLSAPPPPPGPFPAEEEDEPGQLIVRRFGGLFLWALIVLSALLSNLCSR